MRNCLHLCDVACCFTPHILIRIHISGHLCDECFRVVLVVYVSVGENGVKQDEVAIVWFCFGFVFVLVLVWFCFVLCVCVFFYVFTGELVHCRVPRHRAKGPTYIKKLTLTSSAHTVP